jgi:hypothetical protein
VLDYHVLKVVVTSSRIQEFLRKIQAVRYCLVLIRVSGTTVFGAQLVTGGHHPPVAVE